MGAGVPGGLQIRMVCDKWTGRFDSYTPPPYRPPHAADCRMKKEEFLRRLILGLLLVVTCSFAQRTLFTQPIGSDTFRIKGDACLWTRYYFQQTTDSLNVKSYDNSFGRAYGFIGATVQYGRYAYARYYYDLGEINGKPAYDLIAGLACCNFDFRFGQLKPPTGYENMAAPWKVDFIENTLASANHTPTGLTRDIGLQVSYNHKYFQPIVALVNGNGRNVAKDNNMFKDVVFRAMITPLGKPALFIGGNGYIGNDTFAAKGKSRPFTRYSGEVCWVEPKFFVRGEYLMGKDTMGAPDTLGRPTARKLNSFYVAAGFRAANIQPVVRYEQFTLAGNKTTTLAFGANYFAFHDMVKPMLNVSLIRDAAKKADYAKVMFQVQAAFW